MTREHADRRICDFISAGTKNYGFVHESRVPAEVEVEKPSVLKVRGFRVNYDAREHIKFERMKSLIKKKYLQGGGGDEEIIDVPTMEIGRTVRSDLFTRHSTKKWRVKYSKGVVNTSTPHLDVYPFGFVVDS